MTNLALPREDGAPRSGLGAALRHARYILRDNAVTGFAFALFVLIVLAALFGPYLVPYDPLASDTAAALKPPSLAHWFGTDQLGRDVFSRVIVATRPTIRSVQPPKNPAATPASPPKKKTSATEVTAMRKSSRVATITRLNTSRPS